MTDQLTCNCGIRQHIQKMIDKCKVEMREIEEGKTIKPQSWMNSNEMWFDLLEERHEYLSELQSKLQFMLDYPEREQVV